MLFVVAAIVAVGDWVAVYFRLFRLEYVLKPLTMALLVVVAVTANLSPVQPEIVAGLVLGLVGDVALMLSRDGRPDRAFLVGLGAFALGHVAYVVAFAQLGLRLVDVLAGLLIVGGVSAIMLPTILRRVDRSSGHLLTAAVAGYALLLGAMTVLAVGSGILLVAIGGVLFLLSDTTIAWQRFVRPFRYGEVAIIVSYHAAQLLILAGVVRAN